MNNIEPDVLFRISTPDTRKLYVERQQILSGLRDLLPDADICEIGSTAIDGIIGKNDLDIAIKVPAYRFNQALDILDRIYPRNQKQLSNEEYQSYIVPSDIDIAIQLFIVSGPYDNFETFLIELRASSALREKYNDLKLRWDGKSMSAYREAKQKFIQAVLAKASKRVRPQ